MRGAITLRTPALAQLVRLLTLLLALAVLWYGLMAGLLAVKVSPRTVNELSAYRTLFNDAYNLRAHDITTVVRLIAGLGGLLVFGVFAYLTLQVLPRPRVVRAGDLGVGTGERGATTVRPRVLERVAEVAAEHNDNVTEASGRLHQASLDVGVAVRRAGEAAGTLRDVHDGIAEALARHGLPAVTVNIVLTGLDGRRTEDLS